ncbi:type I-C CRISPR-associated protein Cas8c/Csd1 [Roseiconus lacunae]|uniref:type I-C CRISPR-associated protein Cas8c/Csd1 n=1 Tax=Roseiconus lacunae TaxID=2605694 RepID=UPI0030870CAC|nr:type I-C CRISPR-associated protein Cas8c/Csd1 [Stieleria sp. HD01]
MLHELLRYAQREGIDSEPGFGPRWAKFLIVFDAQGNFVRVLKYEESRRGREFAKCPVLSQGEMVGNKLRHFLIDSVDKIALLTKDEPGKKEIEDHERFVSLLKRAGETLPRCLLLAKALKDSSVLSAIRDQLTGAKAKPTDASTLGILDQDQVVALVDQTDWHDWWREFLASLQAANTNSAAKSGKKQSVDTRMRCFLSGELVEPAATQNKINGLSDVGGLPTGDVISSFDKDAFGHFGLTKGAIASISVNSVKEVTDSLNHVIQHRSRKLGNAKVAFWYDRQVPTDLDPAMDLFAGETIEDTEVNDAEAFSQRLLAESSAARLLQSVSSGENAELADASFYSLTLSGNSGRVMFRDWSQGRLEDLAKNVLAWFEDLSIVSRDGKKVVNRFKFLAVVGATVRDLKDAPPPLVATLWKVATQNRPIPHAIAAQTLNRVRIDIIQGDSPRLARLGLLRAFLLRHPNFEKRGFKMSPRVDDSLVDQPAYLCGRIMALLDTIQHVALGDIGVGVVQRYYASASTTPGLVLGRMIRNAQVAHFPKARSDERTKGLAIKIERQIQDLMSQMTSRLPASLDLEEQTLFALGFYQQQADRYTKKSEPKQTVTGS